MQNHQSEKVAELFTALGKVQATVKAAKATEVNPFFGSKYADLTAIWEVARAPLAENGLAVIQTFEVVDGHFCLRTTLGHTSGQWISGLAPLVMEKQNAQSLGSACSYMRRYSLAAIVGIVTEDDDAETAVAPSRGQSRATGVKSLEPVKSVLAARAQPGNPGEFVVPFGRDQGKRIDQLSAEAIHKSVEYWEDRVTKEGNPPTGKLKDFLFAAHAYLAMEHGDSNLPDDLPFDARDLGVNK